MGGIRALQAAYARLAAGTEQVLFCSVSALGTMAGMILQNRNAQK